MRLSFHMAIQNWNRKTLPVDKIDQNNNEIDTVLILSGDDQENLAVSKMVKKSGLGHVIVLVNEASNLERFKLEGVQVYSPALYRPTIISLMARNPSMFDLLSSTSQDRSMLELQVRNQALVGKKIRDLFLPGDSLILSIKRADEIIIPHGNSKLEQEDQVSILVNQSSSLEVKSLFDYTTDL